MTAREQDKIVRRAFEGGTFGEESEVRNAWSDSEWCYDEKERQVPSPEQFATAADLVLRAEEVLGEPVAPARRFRVFEIAYWGEQRAVWKPEFRLALEEMFWSLP